MMSIPIHSRHVILSEAKDLPSSRRDEADPSSLRSSG